MRGRGGALRNLYIPTMSGVAVAGYDEVNGDKEYVVGRAWTQLCYGVNTCALCWARDVESPRAPTSTTLFGSVPMLEL